MKKNLKKKNNKGFTLVELIVVVLIMAILAVTLAPQVMKWVNNSRKSSDVTTYESLVSGAQLALSDEAVYNAISTTTETIKIYDTDQNSTTTGNQYVVISNTTLASKLTDILGDAFITTKPKVDISTPYIITITKGVIDRTTAPDTDMD